MRVQVTSLDRYLGSIRAEATKDKLSFRRGAKVLEKDGKMEKDFVRKAAVVLSKVKGLKKTASAYLKLSDADKHTAMMEKDK